MSASSGLRLPVPMGQAARPRRHGFWWQAGRRLLRQPVTLVALAVLLAVLLAGALAHELAPEGWNWINLSTRWKNHAPTLTGGRLFGTDGIGHSILVRTLWGLHFTEQVAVVGALLAVALGFLVGAIAAYYGGLLDAVLMRLSDFVSAFPVLLLMIVAFEYFAPITVWRATLIFGFSLCTFVARVVRARIASLREEEFVEAARAAGASDLRILMRHLLPNTAGVLVVSFTSVIGQIVLVEATIEFFGFGVSSVVRPTLGNLIAEYSSSFIAPINFLGLGWWTWGGPAFVLVLVLVSLNLVGDGLEAALDPRRVSA